MSKANGKKRSKKAKASPTANTQQKSQPDDGKEEETDESLAERFERELSWCVEQLQLGLETQNPDSKQSQEAMKILRILVSSKAPMIKKRQAMRTTFGDYRAKMREQEKKSAAAAKKMKLLPVEDKGYQKSTFFRKSAKRTVTGGINDPGELVTADKTPKLDVETSNKEQQQEHTGDKAVDTRNCGNGKGDKSSADTDALNASFKFDFKLDDKTLTEEAEKDHKSEVGGLQKESGCDNNAEEHAFNFSKSENEFRFNFSAVDDES